MTAGVTRGAVVPCPFCATLNRVDLSRVRAGPKCGGCARPLLLDRPVKVTAAELDQVVHETTVPVVVDFYADWCGPCRLMAPLLDELARDRGGEILVLKLDTDRAPELTVRLGIRGVPTLIVYRSGVEAARHVGLARRDDLDRLAGPTA